jgi:hypothetical protein
MGWVPGILNYDGPKPKGMHWNTFAKLSARHDAFSQISLSGLEARLTMMDDDWWNEILIQ